MSFRQYLILMIIGAVTAWVAFILAVLLINPETTNTLGFVFFYLSLFSGLTLTFALAGYYIRSLRKKENPLSWQVNTAFRQGIFFAIIVCGALFLMAENLFSWLNLFFLILIITSLEFFLINKKSNL